MKIRTFLVTMLLVGLVFTGVQAQKAEKEKINKLDDLPRYSYPITTTASELVQSEAAFAPFAARVRADIEGILDRYEIEDQTTLKNLYGTLESLDMLDGDYNGALQKAALIRNMETKPAEKLLSGLTTEVIVKARREAPQGDDAAFKAAFERYYAEAVDSLPWDLVQDQIQQIRGMAEMFSENLLLGVLQTKVDPVIEQTGEISLDLAERIISYRFLIEYSLPFKAQKIKVLKNYIDAHHVVKPDIWKERSVVLTEADSLQPVVVAIWDSGIDTVLYKGHLFVNEKESLDGRDDDGNGFVDDRHGIAFTLHEEKTPEMLYPIDDSLKSKLADMRLFMKGLLDMQASVDSKEAGELRKQMAQLKPEEAQPLFERLGLYGNYMHGTHVGGIAIQGNPFAKILVARLSFDYHMIPEAPTVEMAKKSVVSNRETVDYFKAHNVRVVNMSWGGDLKMVEQALEANGIGETPEERAKLAREIFDISKNGLYEAMKSAPNILFVTSAGNEDNDVAFDEVIPSSFDLPNLLVVGAVDQAGEETSFSSFGANVDVYANGFEVESNLPGGARMAVSGTSQASPQVTNLAAKLLAVNPDLTVAELKDLIIKGTDKSEDGRCNLINPKKSMALLTDKMHR